jgi:hypothetical protein
VNLRGFWQVLMAFAIKTASTVSMDADGDPPLIRDQAAGFDLKSDIGSGST